MTAEFFFSLSERGGARERGRGGGEFLWRGRGWREEEKRSRFRRCHGPCPMLFWSSLRPQQGCASLFPSFSASWSAPERAPRSGQENAAEESFSPTEAARRNLEEACLCFFVCPFAPKSSHRATKKFDICRALCTVASGSPPRLSCTGNAHAVAPRACTNEKRFRGSSLREEGGSFSS